MHSLRGIQFGRGTFVRYICKWAEKRLPGRHPQNIPQVALLTITHLLTSLAVLLRFIGNNVVNFYKLNFYFPSIHFCGIYWIWKIGRHNRHMELTWMKNLYYYSRTDWSTSLYCQESFPKVSFFMYKISISI